MITETCVRLAVRVPHTAYLRELLFRHMLRRQLKEKSMSMILGHFTPEEAGPKIHQPVQPSLGALPWKPRRGMKMIRELNHWNVPTAGVLRHRWRPIYYLFRCLDGASSQYSVWAYASLSRAEARELKELVGEDLRRRQNEIFQRGDLCVAVAEETSGVIHRVLGRLDSTDPEPRLAPEVGRQVQEEIQSEASAIRGMPVFASAMAR